jgi:hypothetical protein
MCWSVRFPSGAAQPTRPSPSNGAACSGKCRPDERPERAGLRSLLQGFDQMVGFPYAISNMKSAVVISADDQHQMEV